MKVCKETIQKYYKEIDYTRPNLTSPTNGSFEVWGVDYYDGIYYPAWQAFAANTGYSFAESWEGTVAPSYIAWRNVNQLYIPKLTIRNSSSDHQTYWIKAGELQYWNGSVWKTEQVFTNTVSTNGAYWEINVTNPVWSHAKRLYITSAGSANYPMISDIQFNDAKERVLTTQAQSTYIEVADNYSSPFISQKYKAVN